MLLRVTGALVTFCCAAASCSGRKTQPPDSRPATESTAAHVNSPFHVPPSQAGLLTFSAGVLRFAPCGSKGPSAIVTDLPDQSGMGLVRSLRGLEGTIPVMLRLDGNKIVEIRHATPENSCEHLQGANELEARGNEPFWAVEVDGDSARLRVPLSPNGVSFHNGAWRQLADSQWAYEARREEGGTTVFLELQLTAARCFDSMSAALYPFRAALVRDGNPAAGCAVEGRRARTSPR